MSNKLKISSQNEKNVVNCIRWLNQKSKREKDFCFTKNDIATKLNVQWATVSSTINTLKKNGVIDDSDGNIKLNGDIEYYIGISIGTSRIKMFCGDFNFEPMKLNDKSKEIVYNNLGNYENYLDFGTCEQNSKKSLKQLDEFQYCFNINTDDISVFTVLNDMCRLVLEFKKNDLNIGGVGFAFPGIVNYEDKTVTNSYIFNNLSNITLKDLIYEDIYNEFIEMFEDEINENQEPKINYMFDQNNNAACVAEKELGNIAPPLQNNTNLTVIYGGYGYGVGFILNNKLFRGGSNQGGQVGHIQVKPYPYSNNTKETMIDIPCRCGMTDCLENRINVDVFDRGRVYNDEEVFKSLSINKLCEILDKNSNKKKVLSYYLCQVIDLLSKLMGSEHIVLTGRLSEYYKLIKDELKNMLLTKFFIDPKAVDASQLGELAAVKGIAIEAYYHKYNIEPYWK